MSIIIKHIYRHQVPGPAVTEERDVDVSVGCPGPQPLVSVSQDALPRLQHRPLRQSDVGQYPVSGGR